MIKTIIFDNGGVIVKDGWLTYLEAESERLGLDKKDFSKMLTPLVKKAVTGKINFVDFLDKVSQATGDPRSVLELKKTPPLDKVMVDLIKRLSGSYRVALLSNDLGGFDEDNKVWKMEEIFGKNIYNSSRMKVAKPNAKAFIKTLKGLKNKPNETIFIDDKQKNIEVAQSLGINGILFKTPFRLKQELKKYITI